MSRPRLASKRTGTRMFLTAFCALLLIGAVASASWAGLLVGSFGTDEVLHYDEATGASLGAFVPAGSGGLSQPTGLAFGPDGNLYVGSRLTNSVLRYDPRTGGFLGAFVPNESGGLISPVPVTFGPDRNLYVGGVNGIFRYNGTTGAFLGAFEATAQLVNPFDIVFGPDGRVYVSSSFTASVLRFDAQTGAFLDEFIPADFDRLSFVSGMAFGADGNLYLAASNGVARYNGTTGEFIDMFVPPFGAGLASPQDLLFGPDGNLYVANIGFGGDTGNSVLRFDGDTGDFIDAFVAPGSGGLSFPVFLVFTPTAVPEVTPALLVAIGLALLWVRVVIRQSS